MKKKEPPPQALYMAREKGSSGWIYFAWEREDVALAMTKQWNSYTASTGHGGKMEYLGLYLEETMMKKQGPTDKQIGKALKTLQKELESPEFAAAIAAPVPMRVDGNPPVRASVWAKPGEISPVFPVRVAVTIHEGTILLTMKTPQGRACVVNLTPGAAEDLTNQIFLRLDSLAALVKKEVK